MSRSLPRFILLFIVGLLAFGNLSSALAQSATPQASPVATPGHGIQTADMDLTADPTQDFYRFANGGWLDRTEIPPDRASRGVFDDLTDASQETQLTILSREAQSGDLEEGSDTWKVVQIFSQGMDTDQRNANGIAPIQGLIDDVDAITDVASLQQYLVTHALDAPTGLFSLFVQGDLADSSMNAAYLSGPALGLPNRDYYLEDDAANQAVRDAYTESNTQFLMLLGMDEASATAAAKAVFELEKSMAATTLTREEQQDYSNFYNPTTVADMGTLYANFDWAGYLKALGVGSGVDTIIVTELKYLQALEGIVAKTSIDTVKEMLKLQIMWFAAPYLDTDTYDIYFNLNGKALAGATTPLPVESRVLNHVNGIMGEAVGQLYVAEAFPPEAKAQITTLVNNILAAYKIRLENNTWMSPETKQIALDKLSKVGLKVGYPDQWRSYDAVQVGPTYVGSIINGTVAEAKRVFATAGKPVDRSEWGINPQEVNAYYDPQNNEIVFPAAILQAPFFDYQADAASNYGGIGFVIGHEITHGFDITGSQFDADGNLNQWWTDADQQAFDSLQQKVVDQYSAIEVLPGLTLDGQIEVGENVADLGGIQNAYAALEATLAADGNPGKIDGFTQEQRFFIAAAQVWREKIRDEALTTQVKTDPHAPGSVRGVQPLRNKDAFFEAFNITEGDAMYLAPADRIVIW